MTFPEYAGMTYDQASVEAGRLISMGGGWFANFDRLAVLRRIVLDQAGE